MVQPTFDEYDHDSAALVAREHYDLALSHLLECARIMRSPCVQASREAMQTEIGLTRAIEALTGNGFKAPRIG